ncbi:MAG: hypothetical protein M3Z37_00840 [Candidatus Eremiobacteraeota bacterium]|nr:hypothetical protein [Candidatus Eremiobacteraeota bacterium]
MEPQTVRIDDLQVQAQRVRELKNVLLRLGARRAAGYYASPLRIFAGNFAGGAIVGALATLLGFAVLGLGARHGAQSVLYHIVQVALAWVDAMSDQLTQGGG